MEVTSPNCWFRKMESQQAPHCRLARAPSRVHLNVQDVTVAEAVAQLSLLSGYPIQLQGNASILAARRVTLDTGDSTFWEAARQLCDKAGLVDTMDFHYRHQEPLAVPVPWLGR